MFRHSIHIRHGILICLHDSPSCVDIGGRDDAEEVLKDVEVYRGRNASQFELQGHGITRKEGDLRCSVSSLLVSKGQLIYVTDEKEGNRSH